MIKVCVNLKYFLIFICIGSLNTACSKKQIPAEPLSGSGSSFSIPFSDKMIKYFDKKYNQSVTFSPNNSYQGIQDLINGKVDFVISSVYLTDEEMKKYPDILHIPVSVAGINFVYNISAPGFTLEYDDPIYLTPDIIAKIFLGQITNWNDKEIVAVNKKDSMTPNRVFPNLPITVIQREGMSGDTFLLTTFLNKASLIWRQKIGITNIIPTKGIRASNALDVMRKIIDTDGSFGYSTMAYGVQNSKPVVRVRNKFGVYVRGCNFRSAEAMKANLPTSDNRVDLTYPDKNDQSAVATGFTYILIKKEQNYNNRTKKQAQTTINFINWLLSPEAQRQLDIIFFAPLTPPFRASAKEKLQEAVYNGEQIVPQELFQKK